MTSTEDHNLIKQSLAGNKIAQGQLYRKYVKAMYHVAIRMVPDQSVAKDLVQDAFLVVFRELKKFRGASTLGAWIKRITINTCLGYLKKKGRLQFEEVTEQTFTVAEYEEVESTIEMSEIHGAIKLLPDGCRTILSLFLLEGYLHSEIAEILNISTSTSKTQYRRAKHLLREKLKPVYYNEN